MPFELGFPIPIAKVATGSDFAALLTVEGAVYTWGSNGHGQLGIGNEKVLLQLRPDVEKPLLFKDEKNPEKPIRIVDIAAGSSSMIAQTDDQKVFVWGLRMGIYPQIELSLE